MNTAVPSTDLAGKLLIAMPSMGDQRFANSVVFVCAHSDEGAMGLIINKATPEIDLGMLLEQLSIDTDEPVEGEPVHFGGPVETGRGFVLHSPDYTSVVTTLEVTDAFHMTATLDILEEIGRGTGPADRIMCLGYAGWGPGQLEAEFAENGWLVCEATRDLVFSTPDDEKWGAALATLGVNAVSLSSEGGRA
ncbi:putative transcriptional regulator [Roseivivax marinus]|uniref:YqgE/AlgH family protein n=1 Tax=Roseivivax marinus TaxID=1379903 RepID=UPI0008C66A3B|nr:YqgE/AlgH family protein [Roseivivax marinus]SEK87646.1 putative transcriptional regulator [Roseivivax marinus]